VQEEDYQNLELLLALLRIAYHRDSSLTDLTQVKSVSVVRDL
jgi:hypothetical protein